MARKDKRRDSLYQSKWRKANRVIMRECARKYREENPLKLLSIQRQYRKRNPEKIRARTTLNKAVRVGRVIRPDTCGCGRGPVEGHHPDYSKPLMVVWLCQDCHKKLHIKEGDDNARP